ncbi:MAG: response regulator, partial [Methylococcaceae bacterium]
CAICHMPINGEYVSLEVKDNGFGISDQLQQQIFDPFFTTKDIGKGTGLGLSQVQGIVKKNGGHLLIKSDLGLGTIFQLLFPCADKDAEAVTSVAPVSIANAPMPKRNRIWVVDDNSSLSGYYLELLEKQGYQVTLFTDPAEALHLFKLDPDRADLLFTDQTMPHLSGAELACAMLAIKPGLPVVLISGYSDSMNAEAAKKLGIRCYLTKPVDEKKLLHILASELYT